jgi:DNA-binding GntR family transcriptional regulator
MPDGAELRSRLVARRMREAILKGELRPGDRIAQEAIAREFGTSRVPVREALAELASEGLVTVVPHSGARVAGIDLAAIDEIYRMREAVEPMLIAESADHLTDGHLAQLRSTLGEIEDSVTRPEEWLRLDRHFHATTYAGSDRSRTLSVVETLWNRTQHYRRAFVFALDTHSFEISHMEHRAILDALVRRSGEDAASALLTHIRRTRATLVKRASPPGQP